MLSDQFCYRWFLLFDILYALLIYSNELNILAYDDCEILNCPVDCNVTFSTAGDQQCPGCQCLSSGQRCLPMICPTDSSCEIVQRLDGCSDCACQSVTYEYFDEERNVNVFSTEVFGSIPRKETCSLADSISIESCASGMINYMRLTELKNANLASQPIYSMFLYDSLQINEICAYYNRALRCLNSDLLARCRDKHRNLHMVDSMFQSICDALSSNNQESQQFSRTYDCLRNILTSHRTIDYCSDVLTRRVEKAARAQMAAGEKRAEKCAALNDFLDCAQQAARDYCAPEAAQFFVTVLLAARQNVAPECDKDPDHLRFVPWPANDGSTKIRFGSANVARQANKFLVASSKSREIANASPFRAFTSNDVLDGDKLADLLEQTNNARKAAADDAAKFNRSLSRDSLPKNEEIGKQRRSACDKILDRTLCPGTLERPRNVTRWFKKLQEPKCESYQYTFCGAELEAQERPIKYKEQCTQICS